MTRACIFNFGKPESTIPTTLLNSFLLLFNMRSKRICSAFEAVNRRKDGYKPLKGSKCFTSFQDMLNCSFFENNSPVFSKVYFMKKFNNFFVLFMIDFSEKKIFYFDPKQSDRAVITNDLQEFFDQTQEEVSLLFSTAPDFNELIVEIYPYQYYKKDRSDFQNEFQILLIIYFLETDVPIWYTTKLLKKTFKINFAYWLVKGALPF